VEVLRRQHVADNLAAAAAKALDYSLKRWTAFTRFVDDPQLPADNNWIENRISPIALGRSKWSFAGSLRAGQRAAAVMSLIQSARMNGHDPYASRMCSPSGPRTRPAESWICYRIAGRAPTTERQARPPTAVNMGFSTRLRSGLYMCRRLEKSQDRDQSRG